MYSAIVGLQKSYNVPVLKDFDFTLLRGEVHALVGSNGAGKSTFARILSGLTAPDAGEMRFNGNPYSPGSKHDAENMSVIMVLQELNVIATLTVAENIFSTACRAAPGSSGLPSCMSRPARRLAALASPTSIRPLQPVLSVWATSNWWKSPGLWPKTVIC